MASQISPLGAVAAIPVVAEDGGGPAAPLQSRVAGWLESASDRLFKAISKLFVDSAAFVDAELRKSGDFSGAAIVHVRGDTITYSPQAVYQRFVRPNLAEEIGCLSATGRQLFNQLAERTAQRIHGTLAGVLIPKTEMYGAEPAAAEERLAAPSLEILQQSKIIQSGVLVETRQFVASSATPTAVPEAVAPIHPLVAKWVDEASDELMVLIAKKFQDSEDEVTADVQSTADSSGPIAVVLVANKTVYYRPGNVYNSSVMPNLTEEIASLTDKERRLFNHLLVSTAEKLQHTAANALITSTEEWKANHELPVSRATLPRMDLQHSKMVQSAAMVMTRHFFANSRKPSAPSS